MEIDEQAIGERLRDARIRAGLTSEKAADLAGVSPNSVLNWEKGKSTPTIVVLLKLCEAYRVRTTEILSDAAPPPLPHEVLMQRIRDRGLRLRPKTSYLVDLRALEQVLEAQTVEDLPPQAEVQDEGIDVSDVLINAHEEFFFASEEQALGLSRLVEDHLENLRKERGI